MAMDDLQRTQGWFLDRLGYATASKFKAILAKGKGGAPSATRKSYIAQLVCDILTGKPGESFCNAAMQRGTDLEPFAKMAYEERTGIIVQEVGFIKHATLRAGASPDGLADEGMIEIKCPDQSTHQETLLCGMDSGHMPQVQGQMWITGRPWNDFVSYDDRFPPEMQLYIQRIFRDEAYIKNLEVEVTKFLLEVDQAVIQLKEKYHGITQ